MGEKQNRPFQLSFNTSLRSIFKDRGSLPTVVCCWCANWDEPLGLSALIIENIMGDQCSKNTQLPLPDLLRQSIYSRLAGYEDVNMRSVYRRTRRSADRLHEDLGARSSVAFAPPLVRDRSAEP
jgi:hypothetical protein